MNSVTSIRRKTLKSRIPVPVRKVNSSNLIQKESKICKEQPLSKASTCKTSFKTKKLVEKSSSQAIKPVTVKISKEKIPPEKSCREIVKKRPPLISQAKHKTIVKNETTSLNEKQEKINVLIDKSSNNSTCSQTSKKSADKLVSYPKQDKNKLLISKDKHEKENQEKSETSCFPDQNDIKFESNEDFRKMILRDRGLSPSVCKLASGFKSSSIINFSDRPSAYQKFKVHPNPFQEAMQAIANISAKRGNRKISEMVVEKRIQSPFKPRNSLYTPGMNPREEVMKSLQALRAKQMIKNTLQSSKKKVTFSSNIEEYTAKVGCDTELIPCKSTEGRLTQISEGSAENTPCSPVSNRTDTSGIKEENSLPSLEFQNSCEQVEEANQIDSEQIISSSLNKNSDISTPVTKSTDILRPVETDYLTVGSERASFYSLIKTNTASASIGFDDCDTKFKETFSCQRTIHSTLLEKYRNDHTDQRTSKTKLYTPRPISFSSNSGTLRDNCSPEFFDDKISGLLSNFAPIYTPLVLKNIAKHSSLSPDADLSPVRLKLDFTATESDTPKKETSVKTHAASVKNILTARKKLDDLADQECSLLLLEAGIPVVCGRYLQNPVAVTLTEGDEMHFVPVGF